MLKKPLAVVMILALCLLATPAMAQAGTWMETPGTSTVFTDLFEAFTAWWGSLLGADETLEKNGCGIDPNGQPLCGGWTGAEPANGGGTTEEGSGN